MKESSSAATQTGGSHLLVHGLGRIFEHARKFATSKGPKAVCIDMSGASSKVSAAHRIIEAFLERQSDEVLENPEFKKRLARACARADAGTFGKCACGISLSADLVINGDALTEYCPACALVHANKRAEEFRQIMEGMLETANRELEVFRRQSEELALHEGTSRKGGDEADRSVDDTPRKVLETLIGNRINQIGSIEGALARIKAGEYGICEGCSEEIPIGRLKVVPFTRTCVRCKGI